MNWYAVRTVPIHRIEFEVAARLHQHERPALVPYETKWIKRPKKRFVDARKYPLFPCYVFAQFNGVVDFLVTRDSINKLSVAMGKAPLIVGLVGYGAQPATLTDEDVAFLQSLSAPAATEVNLHKAIRKGGKAEIVKGQFAGHVVEVAEVSKRKAKVMLHVFNAMHVVEIDASALVAA